MKERKHIDRLYQEKFKEFEAVPNEVVWKCISSKLQEGKRRRALTPLWYRIAGIAALLALILLLGNWFTSPQEASFTTTKNNVLENLNTIIPSEEITVVVASEENVKSRDFEKTVPEKAETPTPSNITKTEKIISEITSISSADYKNTSPNFETTTVETLGPDTEKSVAELRPIKKKSLFEEIEKAQEGETFIEDIPKNKFEISTYAAPVFYGNLGDGSFLGPQFNNNESTSEVTYSYGIQLAYAISKNLKIRSGINKVSLSYNTQGIAYHSVIRPSAISTVNYPKDQADLSTSLNTKSKPISGTFKRRVGTVNGAFLNQELGYLEVPVTLEYNIINKKIELNIIGGASTLFLEDNMVSVNSGNLTTKLGAANNLNNVSFSTNIGLGLDYNLTERFKLNLEPIFKYQINTFNSDVMNFQPFYMAIYTGLSFEF